MNPMSRIEELASRYLLGNLDAAELSEFEELLAQDRDARDHFARICVDEVLLRDALGVEPGAELAVEAAQPAAGSVPARWATHAAASRAAEPREALRGRRWVPAAAAVLAFLSGWTLSPRIPPRATPGDLSDAARPSPAPQPLPIYFPQEALQEARLVVYPLDFDESGTLTTNPFVQYEPSHTTEL